MASRLTRAGTGRLCKSTLLQVGSAFSSASATHYHFTPLPRQAHQARNEPPTAATAGPTAANARQGVHGGITAYSATAGECGHGVHRRNGFRHLTRWPLRPLAYHRLGALKITGATLATASTLARPDRAESPVACAYTSPSCPGRSRRSAGGPASVAGSTGLRWRPGEE